jgi:hypothetical protein
LRSSADASNNLCYITITELSIIFLIIKGITGHIMLDLGYKFYDNTILNI